MDIAIDKDSLTITHDSGAIVKHKKADLEQRRDQIQGQIDNRTEALNTINDQIDQINNVGV